MTRLHLQGWANAWSPAVAYRFCLNLAEKFSQPGTHFLAQPCTACPVGHLNIWYRFRPFLRHWRAVRATPLAASITKAVSLSPSLPPCLTKARRFLPQRVNRVGWHRDSATWVNKALGYPRLKFAFVHCTLPIKHIILAVQVPLLRG